MNKFVSAVGSIELDNDCPFSLDLRSTRSRETISKEDLPFYFKEFIQPKYGLDNINVNNVASFMKDLEMNWTKLSPTLKDKVVDIMVDGILNNPASNYDFKNKLLTKLGVDLTQPPVATVNQIGSKSTFGEVSSSSSLTDDSKTILLAFVCVVSLYIIADTVLKPKNSAYRKTV
jgi:hypothetical protein